MKTQHLTEESKEVLHSFSRTLRREAHVLAKHPDLLWVQFYNRLQWEGEKLIARLQIPYLEHLVNRTCGNRGAAINCNGQGNRCGWRRILHV